MLTVHEGTVEETGKKRPKMLDDGKKKQAWSRNSWQQQWRSGSPDEFQLDSDARVRTKWIAEVSVINYR